MAYNTKRLHQKCMEVIKSKKLFFISDIVAALRISTSTYYEHFPKESKEYEEQQTELLTNKLDLKISMRAKWHASDNASLQMGLMKLICTPEEREMLAVNYLKNEHSGEVSVKRKYDLSKLSDQALDELENAIITDEDGDTGGEMPS